jgi:hypothetical protein
MVARDSVAGCAIAGVVTDVHESDSRTRWFKPSALPGGGETRPER